MIKKILLKVHNHIRDNFGLDNSKVSLVVKHGEVSIQVNLNGICIYTTAVKKDFKLKSYLKNLQPTLEKLKVKYYILKTSKEGFLINKYPFSRCLEMDGKYYELGSIEEKEDGYFVTLKCGSYFPEEFIGRYLICSTQQDLH